MSPALTFYFLFLSHHDFLHTSCYHALLCAYARLHDIISYAFIFNVVVSCIETVSFVLCITVVLSVAVSYRIRI